MLGRIAVPDMTPVTPVARALLPFTTTRLAGLTGSPAWAVSITAGARSIRLRPASLSFDATRFVALDSRGGDVRLDLPVTVR